MQQNNNDSTFFLWLDSKLRYLELPRTEFARIAGVGYQTLHPWRLEDFDPRMCTMIKVCHAVAELTKQPFGVVLLEAVKTTKAYNTEVYK